MMMPSGTCFVNECTQASKCQKDHREGKAEPVLEPVCQNPGLVLIHQATVASELTDSISTAGKGALTDFSATEALSTLPSGPETSCMIWGGVQGWKVSLGIGESCLSSSCGSVGLVQVRGTPPSFPACSALGSQLTGGSPSSTTECILPGPGRIWGTEFPLGQT